MRGKFASRDLELTILSSVWEWQSRGRNVSVPKKEPAILKDLRLNWVRVDRFRVMRIMEEGRKLCVPSFRLYH